MTEYETYESVWDAVADTPGEAANLKARADLMRQIEAIVRTNGWTQAEAARHCGVTRSRIDDLLRGRIARFSLDALVNIAAALGQNVRVTLEAAQAAEFVNCRCNSKPPAALLSIDQEFP